jgi:hypothetical protein
VQIAAATGTETVGKTATMTEKTRRRNGRLRGWIVLKFDHKEQPKDGKLSLVLATYFVAIFVALLDA